MSDLVERAQAALARDDVAAAARLFAEARALMPENGGLSAWLGQCLCVLGRRAEGVALLREAGGRFGALARRTGEVDRLLELATELQHWSDFPGALDLALEATRIRPAEAAGPRLLALSYGQLNRPREALDAATRALALAPGDAMLGVFVASLQADAGETLAARGALERLLAAGLPPREAHRAHKELARVLDKLGAHDLVFGHLDAAAAVAGTLPEYAEHDRAAIPAVVRGNLAGFDRALLGRWAGEPFEDARAAPVFVLGFMRSGTTLTQEVLGTNESVFVSDEVDFVTATLRELHRANPARLSTADKLRRLQRADVAALRRFYWTRVEQRFGPVAAPVFVDKFTMNTIDLGLINVIFPDAKVIFVQRDPRDVCLSCYMQLMVPSPTTVQLTDWVSTAAFYAQVMDWWVHIRERLTLAVTELRYEDAVTAFEPTFPALFAFLGLGWDAGAREFHKRAAGKFIASPSRRQVATPLYSSSAGRWRHYSEAFAPVRSKLEPYVRRFGYAPS